MRIELQEENKEETKEQKEPELKDKHESDMTRKEKRELERQKLKSMSFTGKLGYIWAYYKPQIFGFIGIILLIFIIKDVYENAQIETVLTIAVVDSASSEYEEKELEIEKILGVEEDSRKVVVVDGSLNTTVGGEELDAYGQMAFVTKVQAKTYDVIILPEGFYENLEESDYFAELEEVLGEAVYDSFGDSIDSHHITFDSEELGEQFGLFYEPACMAVLINSEHKDEAAKWIASLAETE